MVWDLDDLDLIWGRGWDWVIEGLMVCESVVRRFNVLLTEFMAGGGLLRWSSLLIDGFMVNHWVRLVAA